MVLKPEIILILGSGTATARTTEQCSGSLNDGNLYCKIYSYHMSSGLRDHQADLVTHVLHWIIGQAC
jgi:hypothetical protein